MNPDTRNLGHTQRDVLYLLSAHGPASYYEIADMTYPGISQRMSPAAARNAIKRLEQRGLIAAPLFDKGGTKLWRLSKRGHQAAYSLFGVQS